MKVSHVPAPPLRHGISSNTWSESWRTTLCIITFELRYGLAILSSLATDAAPWVVCSTCKCSRLGWLWRNCYLRRMSNVWQLQARREGIERYSDRKDREDSIRDDQVVTNYIQSFYLFHFFLALNHSGQVAHLRSSPSGEEEEPLIQHS